MTVNYVVLIAVTHQQDRDAIADRKKNSTSVAKQLLTINICLQFAFASRAGQYVQKVIREHGESNLR